MLTSDRASNVVRGRLDRLRVSVSNVLFSVLAVVLSRASERQL